MEQEDLQAEVSTFIDNVIPHLPATNNRPDETVTRSNLFTSDKILSVTMATEVSSK